MSWKAALSLSLFLLLLLLLLLFLQAQRESVFAKEDQAKKDAFDESDDESAISRTESELREVTKVLLHHTLCFFCNLKTIWGF